MATQAVQKILRIGIIQNGRIIEEKLLRNREPVTVGQNLKKCTFVVATPELPSVHTLFDVKGGTYVLQFTDAMSGRLSVGDQVHDLAALRASGKAKKAGSAWQIELDERARGKVTVGDTTILFQFVTPPPLRVLPQLPANMRGGLLLFVGSVVGLNGVFLATMLLSTLFQVGGVAWLVYMVPPPPRNLDMNAIPDRFLTIMRPETEEPEVDTEVAEADPNAEAEGVEVPADEPADEPSDSEPSDSEPSDAQQASEVEERYQGRSEDEIREIARETVVQQSALGAVFNSEDGVGPALSQVTRSSNLRAEDVIANQAARGAGGEGGIVSTSGIATSSGATGDVNRQAIEGGGSRVAAEAETGAQPAQEEQQVEVRVRVRGSSEQTAGTGTINDSSLASSMRRNERDITRCYERGLGRDPSLAGRVVIQFRITAGGRTDDARLNENAVGEEVGNCILGQIRRWRFDEPEGGDVVVRKAYILESGT